ncbi:epimerase [Labilibaculum manganireducens]|uniref:Epimerase n=1 Tax=Labilibaculum manganireducens TaxID=1940525 RepID=A0A2N3HRQ0_9BACT|nr:NAD-dependent epimerase/dehydratase family protein [Labilibaculum manganireducens]PKQ60730.1 epimerase [Labilibaculum manganireducens]
MQKISVIITGVTGMIGEGLLYQCLNHDNIEKVLVITRKSSGYKHPKLTEIIQNNLSDISSLKDSLLDYNACFYCIGSTSVGKSESQYTADNYTLPLNFATTLANINPDMTFCYISGVGTDSTEKGRSMWARVKGKTENDLMKLPFSAVYNFRPAGLIPFLSLKPTQTYYKTYKYTKWLMVPLKTIFPSYIMDLRILTTALINVALKGYSKKIVEPKDFKIIVGKSTE